MRDSSVRVSAMSQDQVWLCNLAHMIRFMVIEGLSWLDIFSNYIHTVLNNSSTTATIQVLYSIYSTATIEYQEIDNN